MLADPMTEIRDLLKSILSRLDKPEEKSEDADPEDEDAPIESEDAEPEDEKEEEQEAADEGIVIPAGDRPENPIPGADEKKVGDALKSMRKAIAASGDKRAIDAFNSLLPKKTGNTKDGYKAIATRKVGDADTNPVDANADFAAKMKSLHRKPVAK